MYGGGTIDLKGRDSDTYRLNFETACRCQIETAEVLCLV